MNENEVGQFFDTLTGEYTEAIERCFPRYREMLWALLNYLPEGRQFQSVLELGCGTGNLSVLLRDAFPGAQLRLVDVSGESLTACRSRFADESAVEFEQQDFRQLSYGQGEFDLIVSSIAIHHLVAPEKQELFKNCRTWLAEDGVFSFADQCAGVTENVRNRHLQNWKELSFGAGTTDDEWQMWQQHQAEHDHHDTLPDQLKWLEQAGFSKVDCPWRYLLWSMIQAQK